MQRSKENYMGCRSEQHQARLKQMELLFLSASRGLLMHPGEEKWMEINGKVHTWLTALK